MEPCANPECHLPANPDPEVCVGYCCEKCEGRHKGEEWALEAKGKKHTAYCTGATEGGGGGGGRRKAAMAWVPCKNPECSYAANPNPDVSAEGFCCEKCEGRFKGEEWALAQKGKKHTAYCTSNDPSGGLDELGINPADLKGGCKGGWEMEKGYGKGFGKTKAPVKYDDESEQKLDEWVEAKRAKEFEKADAIRDELRAKGIEAQDARPDPKRMAMKGMKKGDDGWGGKGCYGKEGGYGKGKDMGWGGGYDMAGFEAFMGAMAMKGKAFGGKGKAYGKGWGPY